MCVSLLCTALASGVGVEVLWRSIRLGWSSSEWCCGSVEDVHTWAAVSSADTTTPAGVHRCSESVLHNTAPHIHSSRRLTVVMLWITRHPFKVLTEVTMATDPCTPKCDSLSKREKTQNKQNWRWTDCFIYFPFLNIFSICRDMFVMANALV